MGFLKKIAKVASLAAAPMTMGASLIPYGKMEEHDKKHAESVRQRSLFAAAAQQEADELEQRRLAKEADITSRKKKTSGLASLIGGFGEMLG